MTTHTIHTAALHGIDAEPIRVEVTHLDVPADPLPDASLRESLVRVQTALNNCLQVDVRARDFRVRITPPDGAPVPARVVGTALDLPLAVGVLRALGKLTPAPSDRTVYAGELALDGRVRAIRGALSIADHAGREGTTAVLPVGNAAEASVSHATVAAVVSLRDLLDPTPVTRVPRRDPAQILVDAGPDPVDFADVKVDPAVLDQLRFAAERNRPVLLRGSLGCGATMIARRIPSLLPAMTFPQALNVTRVYSVAGLLAENQALVTRRPFRSPHHTVSDAGLVGGGNVPRPGEASLAHNGVLFLDQVDQFRSYTLDALRGCLAAGESTTYREGRHITYPARPEMLVGFVETGVKLPKAAAKLFEGAVEIDLPKMSWK